MKETNNSIKQTLPNRKTRRMLQKYQNILTAKKDAPGEEWLNFVKENQSDGLSLHNTNVDAKESYLNEMMDKYTEKLIKNWKEFGYNDSEILLLREAYSLMDNKKSITRRDDKKRAKSLIKQAELLKKERVENG